MKQPGSSNDLPTSSSRVRSGIVVVLLAALIAIWLALTMLMLVADGEPEAWLSEACAKFSRPNAFDKVSRVAGWFYLVHTVLCIAAVTAWRRKRTDVLLVLAVGPALTILLIGVTQEWADPNWFENLGISTIGWFVGTIVALGYWLFRRSEATGHPRKTDTDPESLSRPSR